MFRLFFGVRDDYPQPDQPESTVSDGTRNTSAQGASAPHVQPLPKPVTTDSDTVDQPEASLLPFYSKRDYDGSQYDVLYGPSGEVTTLTEPEDRCWSRDGKPVVDLLNNHHAELTALRQENARLKAENFALAAHQCAYPAGDEYGNAYCTRIRELETQFHRLRDREGLAIALFFSMPQKTKVPKGWDKVLNKDFYRERADAVIRYVDGSVSGERA